MSAQIISLTFLIFLFLFSFFAPDIYATGFNNYQLTSYANSSSVISDISLDGEYVAWFLKVFGYKHLYMADILRGRFIPVDTSDDSKQDIDTDATGKVVWSHNSDIYIYGANNDVGARITTDGNNHRKPKVTNTMVTWIGTDGTNDQIWALSIPTREITQITNNSAAKDDPLITYNSTADYYAIFWEEDGVLKYWENESATPTVNTAHTPGGGCSDQINDIVGRGFVVFIEDCASTDVIRAFDVGADVTVTTDDASL